MGIFWCAPSLFLSHYSSVPRHCSSLRLCSVIVPLSGSTHSTPLQVHWILPLPPHFYFLHTITTCSFPFLLYFLFYFHCSSFFGCCIWDLGFNVSLIFCVYHFFPICLLHIRWNVQVTILFYKKFNCLIQTRNSNVWYSNYPIQTSYLENDGNSITRISNAIHFNFLELLNYLIQRQGKSVFG